jgi:beta-glucosidase
MGMFFLPSIDSLSLEQQVAQMVMVRAAGFLFDHQIRYPQWEPPTHTLRRWVQELGVGGVIFLGGSAGELRLRTQQIQEWAGVPLLMAADVEEGVGQRFEGATWFPPPMALGEIARQDPAQAIAYAEQMGAVTTQEAQAIGLNWIFAPVVDVNNNPANPVINVRAFGETADAVSQLASAFIRGGHAYPVLMTAKHFPGHGDTAVDSHLALPILPHSLDRLQAVEFPPFQAAIAAGVDAIMTAHVQLPDLDPHYPATLSDRILTHQLRQTLGFDGLIVTDALVMGAITKRYGAHEASVLAVEAGADIILMPVDPEGTIQAVCAAVREGRIPQDRIQASVERIWRAKQKVCAPAITGDATHAWETHQPTIEPQVLVSHLAQPLAIATAHAILSTAMEVHGLLSIAPPSDRPKRNLILIDDAVNCEFLGRHTPAIALPTTQGYVLNIIDGATPSPQPSPQPDNTAVILQLFIRGNPFRSSASITDLAQVWLDHLLETQQLQALIIYGSPYIRERFVPQLPPGIPAVFTYGQMPDAQAIALQTLFHLPAPTWDRSDFTD